ncbi:MAG: GSCFA domain-containing protein [Tannerellaceae bacterium]|nr:GSCFA domain-containing protein [Tannerellaceae bacterium]
MDLRTVVSITNPAFYISHKEKIMLLGSCFAENIGKKLIETKFQVDQNPFGILYNPASVAQSLARLMNPIPFDEKDIFEHSELYHTFYHHSRFSQADLHTLLNVINQQLVYSSSFLQQTNRLLITFGTAWVYRLQSSGEIVSNCHKLPDKYFIRDFLSVESIVEQWKDLLEKVWIKNPSLQVLFTVSPVRHWKDGAHGNQLSKATLLLAIEALCKRFPEKVIYFPSYEIQLDELRDYRFYADDMLHPSGMAIEYIWQRFAETYFTPETHRLLKEWDDIRKAIQHKPFRPESDTYRSFILQTLLKVEQLEEKFPYFYVTNEKELLLSKLKKNGI